MCYLQSKQKPSSLSHWNTTLLEEKLYENVFLITVGGIHLYYF